MQFNKNTSSGRLTNIGKFLVKVFFILFILFLGLIFVSRIDFPTPNKKIEKIISNEQFKTIK